MSEEQAAPPPSQNIHQAIHAVKSALALHGIGKDRKNAEQKYSFRGVEDVINVLSELFVQHRINITPRMKQVRSVERQTANGKPMPASFVDAEFDLISVDDGSQVTWQACGEGSDMSDKGTNKAMSAAFKYAMTLGFVIPTVGVLDEGDATTPGANDTDDSPRHRSNNSQAEDWAREQIKTWNGYELPQAKQCSNHANHPEYQRLMAELRKTDQRLWEQVKTAEDAAAIRCDDDVPF